MKKLRDMLMVLVVVGDQFPSSRPFFYDLSFFVMLQYVWFVVVLFVTEANCIVIVKGI